MPPRVQASASAATSAAVAGAGSKGENVVSPFTSHCTCPGSSSLPAGKVVPRITRPTWRAIVSSLPTPFITDATAPSANAAAVAAIAGSACIAFVATMPKSHARQRCRVARRMQARVHLAGARQPQAVAR